MRLLRIVIKGYKNYVNHTLDHVSDPIAYSKEICEAIVWAVKGCDLQGRTRTKKEFQWNTNETCVESTWMIREIPVTIMRSVSPRKSHLKVDDSLVKQNDVDKLFGPSDLFLSIFVPGFFVQCPPKRQRATLMSLLPKVDGTSVLQLMDPQQREWITNHSDPGAHLQDLRTEYQEWEEYTQDRQSQIKKLRVASHLNNQDCITELAALKDHLQATVAKSGPSKPDCLMEWEEELKELGDRYRSEHAQWHKLYSWRPLQHQDMEKRIRVLQEKKKSCQDLLDAGNQLRKDIERVRGQHGEDLACFAKEKAEEIKHLEREIHRLQSKQAMHESAQRAQKKLPELEKKLNEAHEELEHLRIQIEAYETYFWRVAEFQVSSANKIMNLAEIKIQKRKLRGETVFPYKLLYEGRDYDFTLSDFTQISQELSRLEQKHVGFQYPVFNLVEPAQHVKNIIA
ncbi:hypothetical protein ABEW19_29705 [Paenibacillus illinoisensis]|uniref:hypothetical protein n=1 Tax=Paenibacillus illinoisensis TaxID=59845 RepID=UPI003D2D172B